MGQNDARLNSASRHLRVPLEGIFGQIMHRQGDETKEACLGFGRGVLFWLLGIPIPIIILLAIFWHH